MKINALIIILSLFTATLQAKEKIVWATDYWDNFTQTDGQGFYQKLISRLFPAEQYVVEVQYMNWARVIKAIETGSIDMTGALPVADNLYFSSLPILSEKILLVRRKGSENPLIAEQAEHLQGTWRQGYRQDIVGKSLLADARGLGVDSALLALKLLNNQRADFYIDIESIVYPAIGDTQSTYKIDEIGNFKLFWAFPDTPKGLALKTLFDRAFAKLNASGELASLYAEHHINMP